MLSVHDPQAKPLAKRQRLVTLDREQMRQYIESLVDHGVNKSVRQTHSMSMEVQE